MSPVDFPLMEQQQKQEIHPPASETRNCVEFPKGKQKAPWNTVQNLNEKNNKKKRFPNIRQVLRYCINAW